MVWVALALAAFQALQGASAKEAAYSDAKKARARFNRLNRQYTNADLTANYARIASARIEDQRRLTESLDYLTRESSQRKSMARVSAAESGVSGNTVDAVLNDFTRIQLENENNILETERFAQDQFKSDVESLRAKAHERLLNGEMDPLATPSYMQEFVNFTSAAIGAYDYEREFNAKYPTKGV